MPDETGRDAAPFRSGFVTFVGRPNVGKSSLVNTICGRKVSIVSDKPQTTRHRIMGVLTRPDRRSCSSTRPGLHKPVTALGERVNATALDSVGRRRRDSASCSTPRTVRLGRPVGRGPLDIARAVVIVNKTDIATPRAGPGDAGSGGRARCRGLLPGLGGDG
jgi:GTPase